MPRTTSEPSAPPPAPLPVAELSAMSSSLEAIIGRLEGVALSIKGTTERADQQSNELQLIASSIGQAQRRLSRMLLR
jgi:methyl-accepting chemotaxis protein